MCAILISFIIWLYFGVSIEIYGLVSSFYKSDICPCLALMQCLHQCCILQVLAVKKVDLSALPNQTSEDFLEVVSNIAKLHHPNVTELVGYCCEHGQYLLVYEFHKNGSLHDFLHLSDEYSRPLTWNTRVKIALGTARALE